MSDVFVYVMYDGENHKIGISADPIERRMSVQRSRKKPVGLIFCMLCKDARGCELSLHHLFEEYNIDGEWFRFPDNSFLDEVFRVCRDGVSCSTHFWSRTSVANKPAEDIEAIIANRYAVTYKQMNEWTNGRYNSLTLPLIMMQKGCVKKGTSSGKIYITPLGMEKGFYKKSMKELQEVCNRIIIEDVEILV